MNLQWRSPDSGLGSGLLVRSPDPSPESEMETLLYNNIGICWFPVYFSGELPIFDTYGSIQKWQCNDVVVFSMVNAKLG